MARIEEDVEVQARIVALSIGMHVIVALGVAALDLAPDRPAPPVATVIELVDVPPLPAVVTPPAAGASAAASRPAASRAAGSSRRRAGIVRTADSALGDPRGAITVDDGTSGDGAGAGRGTGGGGGLGLGDGARIAASTDRALAAPPPPPASKARPAQLVFPVRQRDAADAELFVARVTVDDEGYVVGAKLLRGLGGPRDSQAAELIWKFRYAPALDDLGRPVRSTLEQRFLVGR